MLLEIYFISSRKIFLDDSKTKHLKPLYNYLVI